MGSSLPYLESCTCISSQLCENVVNGNFESALFVKWPGNIFDSKKDQNDIYKREKVEKGRRGRKFKTTDTSSLVLILHGDFGDNFLNNKFLINDLHCFSHCCGNDCNFVHSDSSLGNHATLL